MLKPLLILAGIVCLPLIAAAQGNDFGADPNLRFGERTESTRPTRVDLPVPSGLSRRNSQELELPASLDRGRSLNPELLLAVRDNIPLGLQAEDRDAYFAGLQSSRHLKTAQLEEWAAGFLQNRQTTASIASGQSRIEESTFGDVLEHPQEFRGQLVSMRGVLRRLVKYDPGRNSYGFRHVYEAWIYPHDAQGNPVVVIFTKKPNGLPMGADLNEDVQFTGYFLKNYGYEAQDVPRKAPLFLAGGVDWLEMPELTASAAPTAWGYGSTAVLFFACAWGVARMHQDRRFFRPMAPVFDAQGRLFGEADMGDFVQAGTVTDTSIEHHH
ncbi:MAG TPA: hypothetical protein VFG20_20925 [Planctomycetaceae bacterium]|nr:hypothetical protein [Planctomycetaceae bacterium]